MPLRPSDQSASWRPAGSVNWRENSQVKKSPFHLSYFFVTVYIFFFLQVFLITFCILLHIKSSSKYFFFLNVMVQFLFNHLWHFIKKNFDHLVALGRSLQPTHGSGWPRGKCTPWIPAMQSVVAAALRAAVKWRIRPHRRPTGAEKDPWVISMHVKAEKRWTWSSPRNCGL